jgi:hypothetical protein
MTDSNLRAVPKPSHIIRAPKGLRPVNSRRRRAAQAEDFGELAVFVRRLPCCVRGCTAGPTDPAHVIGKARGHAWLELRLPGWAPRAYMTLAEGRGAAVGRVLLEGAP